MSWMTRSTSPRASRASPAAGVVGAHDPRALERQQHVERGAHGLVVVDDQYRPAVHDAGSKLAMAQSPRRFASPRRATRVPRGARATGGSQADRPQHRHARDEIIELEPRQFEHRAEPVAEQQRQHAARSTPPVVTTQFSTMKYRTMSNRRAPTARRVPICLVRVLTLNAASPKIPSALIASSSTITTLR